ncbi:hypothetical protein NKDENANG_02458 [Candidatus Entotheonellaceae bacterium PAL068K]
MIATDTFTNFARRLAATQGCPYVIIAETPNPIRQLDDVTLQVRVQGIIETIMEGLTQPPDGIRRRNQERVAQQIRPAGVVRAAGPV